MQIRILAVAVFLAALLIPAIAIADPIVTAPTQSHTSQAPSVNVDDSINGTTPGGIRSGQYSGVIPTETYSPITPATTTTIVLSTHTTMDEFVRYVCANQDTLFDEPTYVPACDTELPPTNTPDTNDPARKEAENYVLSYMRNLPLDKPTPQMSSPDGVCGATHYVNLNMRTERVFIDPDAPHGTLHVHAYAATTMDWGDGVSSTYYSAGGPGINSDISHSWTTRGSYDITASSTWTVAWSIGPYNGVLQGIPSTTTINGWQVHEMQARITQG
jgi:hypothetical protein